MRVRAIRASREASVALWLAALFLGACAHKGSAPPCDTPPPFYLSVQANGRLNPDAGGRSLPTLVQVLQLKGLTRLEEADFAAIFQHAADTLGPDLLRNDEFTVDPGSSEGRWIERDPKATHVVVVGVFRQPSGNQWRSVLALPPVSVEACTPQAPGSRSGSPRADDAQAKFHLDEYRIQAVGPPEERR